MSAKTRYCNRTALYLPVHFTLMQCEAAFNRELRRLGVPQNKWPDFLPSVHADACVHFLEHGRTGKQICLVALRQDASPEGIQVASLLVHEAVHIWQFCLELLGETDPSKEFEAYTIQAISQELFRLYAEGANKK